MARASFTLLLLLVLPSLHAQDEREIELFQDTDSRRLSKPDERAKYHPVPVRGMSAADRQRAFELRLKMESESVWGGVKWRNIGPEIQGGRIVDIAVPANHLDQMYFAAATGGLWRTEDGGVTWESLFDDQSAFGLGAVAVSREGDTIYVGTGEANSQRTSYAGTGVFKSTDRGKTWTNVGLPESHHIGRIAIDPKDERTVFVAALGHLYSQNNERGLYRTKDGGKTWRQVLKVDEYTGAIDVVVNPKNPKIVIASMWDRDRRAWNFRESGKGSAVYRSTDGGDTWSKITALPTGDAAGRVGLALCATKPEVVYAFIDNQSDDPDWELIDERVPSGRLTARRFLRLSEEQFASLDKKILEPFWRSYAPEDSKLDDTLKALREKKTTMKDVRALLEKRNPNAFAADVISAEVYRSDDSGKTWRRTETGQLGEFGGYYWGTISVNPLDPDDVTVMGVPLVRSTDGGKTWARIAQESHVDYHAVWYDPRNPKRMWIGCDGGIYFSPDAGKTVRHINNLPLAQATTLAVDNQSPYNVYIGLQDNGTMKGPSNYRPGQDELTKWTDIFGGDGSHISVDPRDGGDIVYIAYQFGAHFGRNQKTGETWNTRANPAKGEPAARYNWISPLIISPHHPDILYIGSQRVYRSFNQGKKWEPISPDITKNRPNGDVPFSTIKDLSESPLKFGLLYAGVDDGTVKMTPDGGATWIDISTPQPEKWVSRVVASRHSVDTVYVSKSGYREDDFRPFLWKSTDRGRNWTSIVGDLPAETINVVREDPWKKDTLYVGTDMGVWVSADGGKHWESLHGGMPNLPVHDLVIQERERDLVAATHARGAFILPLKTLDKVTSEIRSKPIHVYPVEDVTRAASWGYGYRERWDSSEGRKPTVKVAVFSSAAGKAVIRIKDKSGKVVKEASVDAVRGYNDLEIDLQTAPAKPSPLIRERPTDPLKDPYEGLRAQFVPVGEYTLEVEIAGKVASQAFKVTAP